MFVKGFSGVSYSSDRFGFGFPHPRSRILFFRRGGISGHSLALDESSMIGESKIDAVPKTAGSGPSEELAADSMHVPQEYELVDPVDILTPLEKSGFWKGVVGSLLLSIVLFSNF
nr:protein MOR1-like [Ipomoea batatas]